MEKLKVKMSQGKERRFLCVHNESGITDKEGEKLAPLDCLISSKGHGFMRGIYQKCYEDVNEIKMRAKNIVVKIKSNNCVRNYSYAFTRGKM